MAADAGSRVDMHADFAGLARLRHAATTTPSDAVDEVARQFEALFAQQMLEQLRSGALAEDVLGGGSVDQYTEMLHQQLALEMTKGEGLGLRSVLTEQLARMPGVAASSASADEAGEALLRAAFDGRAREDEAR